MGRALIALGIAALAFGCTKTEPEPAPSPDKAVNIPLGLASAEADAWLAERATALEELARTDTVALARAEQQVKFFELATLYDAAAVYAGWEADGRLVVSMDVVLPDDFDPRERPWYQRAVAEGGPVVTEPYVDVGPEKMMVVTIATPVVRDGDLIAVVAMDFEMDTILAGPGSAADGTSFTQSL